MAAAEASGARKLVVESVSFPLPGSAEEAVAELERTARASGLDVVIARFGVFWGPGTWHPEEPADGPAVEVEEAGRRAAVLVTSAPPGTYEIP